MIFSSKLLNFIKCSRNLTLVSSLEFMKTGLCLFRSGNSYKWILKNWQKKHRFLHLHVSFIRLMLHIVLRQKIIIKYSIFWQYLCPCYICDYVWAYENRTRHSNIYVYFLAQGLNSALLKCVLEYYTIHVICTCSRGSMELNHIADSLAPMWRKGWCLSM